MNSTDRNFLLNDKVFLQMRKFSCWRNGLENCEVCEWRKANERYAVYWQWAWRKLSIIIIEFSGIFICTKWNFCVYLFEDISVELKADFNEKSHFFFFSFSCLSLQIIFFHSRDWHKPIDLVQNNWNAT